MITEDSFKSIKKTNNKRQVSFFRKFLFNIVIKVLMVSILFLVSLIYIKTNSENKDKYKEIVYNNSLSFARIYDTYKKYLGDVIPFKNVFKNNTKLVSNDTIIYKKIDKENNGYILTVEDDYVMPSLKSGIVINIINDDTYNTLITIQDKEGLNITYGMLSNLNVELYDYVDKGEILGSANNKLYIEFKKDGKYLAYDGYL